MEEIFVESKNIKLCTEVFGNPNLQCIVLIAGSAGQGILWNRSFCEKLAREGYFIIRFDNRDTGKSSSINYEESPYDLLDLAKDIVNILDKFLIKEAHIFGMSMGGYIAQFLAKYFPERVKSTILFMTAINSLSLRGIRKISNLPGQDPAVINEIAKIYQRPRINLEEKINALVETWRLFNGQESPFLLEECYDMAKTSYERAIGKNAIKNHRLAVLNSEANRTEYLQSSNNKPILIIHGAADPIIKEQHAFYAKEHLPGAKLHIIKKMGHLFTSNFNSEILDITLKRLSEKADI